MMKKSLIALASLAALSSAAVAADVEVYGRIDLGLGYVHSTPVTGDATDTFSMDSGNGTASRWGIKGSEELGNGMKVAFVLENGFTADNGAFKTSGKLFDREATLQLIGDFGTLAMGRSAILGTDGGTFNLLGGINPFGTGMGSIGNQSLVMAGLSSRNDNVVTYRTPKFAGFQVTALYSMGANDTENESGSDRVWGLGLTYKNAGLDTVLLIEGNNEQSADGAKITDQDDMYRITLGGNYDFGVMKLYAAAHYFDNADSLNSEAYGDFKKTVTPLGEDGTFDGLKGYSGMIGVDVPALGGTAKFAAGYQHAKSDELADEFKAKTWFVGAGYTYSFSKRTRWYSGVGYNAAEYEYGNKKETPSAVYVTTGISHYF